jgi:hypothetical protein
MGLMKNSGLRLPWSNIRRRARPEELSLSYLCLVEALASGWQIRSVAKFSGHGRHRVSSYFLVSLTHPTRKLDSELTLEKTPRAEALLRQHGVRAPS